MGVPRRRAPAAATMLVAFCAIGPQYAAAPEPEVIERPPRIASVAGPADSAWSKCAILLEGRTRADAPPQVSMLCLVDGKPSLTVLGPVRARSHSLQADAGPAGSLRILVGRPGGIDEILLTTKDAAPQTSTLVEDDALESNWIGDRPDLDGDGAKDLLQVTFEGVSLWKSGSEGAMTRLESIRIPPFATVSEERVTVYSRSVREPVPTSLVRWTWPESVRGKRLRTYRVPLVPPGGICEAWINTESQVYVSRAEFLSGEPPRLVALVAPSDKFKFFGNYSLMVAPLACDETARGSRPSLLVETEFDSNFGWTALGVRDVTGDGRSDITLVGRQGLTNEKLRVNVHRANADGSFAARPATAVRSDLDPLDTFWDKDVDGDGRLDLVVLDRTRVMLARGIAVKGPGDLPFDLNKPVFAVLPKSLAPENLVHLIDFDGDGKLEALVDGEERKADDKKGGMDMRVGDSVAAEKNVRLVIVKLVN